MWVIGDTLGTVERNQHGDGLCSCSTNHLHRLAFRCTVGNDVIDNHDPPGQWRTDQ